MNDVTAPGGLSEIERVVDTFVAPTKTFADILRSASWWLPFLLLVLSGVGLGYTVQRQVGFDRVAENMVHQSPKLEDRLSGMTPEQTAATMRAMTMQAKFTSYGAPVFVLIFFALYALIVWGSFNFGLGAQTTYGQVFAVVFYAALPFLLINAVAILTLVFGGNSDAFDLKNPAGTNLGYYLPDLAPWLKALLGQIDVIRLWSVGLTIVGMAIVGRKTIMQSAAVILTLWVIGLLLATAGGAFS